jgi:hypothetical protein
MKNLKIKLAVLLLFAISFQSCNLFPDPEEPDYKTELEALLPGTQYLVSYFTGTDHGRFPLQWMQQLAGVRGVHLNVDRYNMTSDHSQEVWNVFYQNIYPNLYLIANHADKIESKAYRGISRILLAYNLGLMTDAWGEIPNMSALDYLNNFFPPYEEQSDVYLYFLDLLNSGINDLTESLASNDIKPGQNQDLIYGGDLNKWIRAANAIRLRYMLRIAHQANNYDLMTTYLTPTTLLAGNQDDMGYVFHGNQINPYYFYDNTVRNTRMGKYLVDKLVATSDPRLPVFVKKNTQNNQYLGSAPAEANFNASFIGTTIAAEKAPVYLMTYVEQKFIEAEIYWRTGQQSLADLSFEQAVKASLQKHNVSDQEWESEHAEIENVNLEQIISAKYVALFLNPEVWSDYRRTGFPQITPYEIPTEEEITHQIPRRFLYPTSEVNYNSQHMPADVTIFSRVWWDIEE